MQKLRYCKLPNAKITLRAATCSSVPAGEYRALRVAVLLVFLHPAMKQKKNAQIMGEQREDGRLENSKICEVWEYNYVTNKCDIIFFNIFV